MAVGTFIHISDCLTALHFCPVLGSNFYLCIFNVLFFELLCTHISRRFPLTWLYNVKFLKCESEDY
jgi:hypothetical protein